MQQEDIDLSEVTQEEICNTFSVWCKDKNVNDMWTAFVAGMGLGMAFSFGYSSIKKGNA